MTQDHTDKFAPESEAERRHNWFKTLGRSGTCIDTGEYSEIGFCHDNLCPHKKICKIYTTRRGRLFQRREQT